MNSGDVVSMYVTAAAFIGAIFLAGALVGAAVVKFLK
jgi:hypothetical protein